jgi:hypothetical protein
MMFSRRAIQALIDDAAATLSSAQLEALVDRLNQTDEQMINATWELIWIVTLGRCGKVAHEPALPGATRFPDIHFQADGFEFMADVATVSDAGYEEENPVEDLRHELNRLYTKYGLMGGFSVRFQSTQVGPYRNNR